MYSKKCSFSYFCTRRCNNHTGQQAFHFEMSSARHCTMPLAAKQKFAPTSIVAVTLTVKSSVASTHTATSTRQCARTHARHACASTRGLTRSGFHGHACVCAQRKTTLVLAWLRSVQTIRSNVFTLVCGLTFPWLSSVRFFVRVYC